MLRKKHSEPAQPDGQQALLEFETPADQPGKKRPEAVLQKELEKDHGSGLRGSSGCGSAAAPKERKTGAGRCLLL